MELSKHLRDDPQERLIDDTVSYIFDGYVFDNKEIPELTDSLSTRLEVVGVDLPAEERSALRLHMFGEIVTSVVNSGRKNGKSPNKLTKLRSANDSRQPAKARRVVPPAEPPVISRISSRLDIVQATLSVPTGRHEGKRHRNEGIASQTVAEAMESIEAKELDPLLGLFFAYIVGAHQPDDIDRYTDSIWQKRTESELLTELANTAKRTAVVVSNSRDSEGLTRFEQWRYEQLLNLTSHGAGMEQRKIKQLFGSLKKPQLPPMDFGRRQVKLTPQIRQMLGERKETIRNAQHRELAHAGRQIRGHQADPDIIPPPTTRVVSYNTAD